MTQVEAVFAQNGEESERDYNIANKVSEVTGLVAVNQ
jgi:hypothetical protein